ncbi:hypothetical protein [Massilia sp. Mn16-1_5]|uniref:hypothetical protein n=1 Tax=Massilia sp. Mn16-1_5 TaxID=2079199 RepID=UPI00109E5AF4|nr:hypothetical protein [Massilia sp. Mn16-1_5]THC39468.1 hypothetical protein C2862_23785 [Massilia sp. Mn16-1_5]
MRLLPFLPLLLLSMAGAATASAAPEAPEAPPAGFDAANAVDSAALDEARGGFLTGDGLMVNLGLERLVSINGNVVERTELQLGDIGKLTRGEANLSADTVGQLRLIQNGDVRSLAGNAQNLLGGTIIQNSLNDQLIKNQTSINATVNTAGMLRALNFGTSLNNALSTAVAPR